MIGRNDAGRRLMVPASVGVIGLTLIGLGQAVPNRHAIEDDLTSRSAQALRSADLAGLSVSFSGRDATITGAGTAALGDRAEAVVSSVRGVRVADADPAGDATTAAATDATPAADPTETDPPATPSEPASSADPTPAPADTARPATFPVGFTLADGTITVTGTVRSTSAQAELIEAVKATGNGWQVVDRLGVDAALTAPAPQAGRLPALTRLLAQAPVDGPKLVIQYNRGTVILRGTPTDADAERTLLTAAGATVPKRSDVIDGLDTPGPG